MSELQYKITALVNQKAINEFIFFRGSEGNSLVAAIIDLTKAIEFSSNFDKAYKNRGWSYAQLGEYTKALEDFNKAIAINPGYAKAYYGRSEVFEKLGKADLAEKDKTKAKELGYVASK